MLAALTGQLVGTDPGKGLVWLALGGATLELHVPQSTLSELGSRTGDSAITLHTHLEFAPQGAVGALRPRLYGFAHLLDKHFFLKLITVKGVGASIALEMMAVPTTRIAAAIESQDEKFLKTLPKIGGSKAKLLIAELGEKVSAFQGEPGSGKTSAAAPADPLGQTVQMILVKQLDVDERDAARLIARAREHAPEATAVETLLEAVFAVRE
ncbi:MAG: Holliday junction branch migration protein RuvA [bacterium]